MMMMMIVLDQFRMAVMFREGGKILSSPDHTERRLLDSYWLNQLEIDKLKKRINYIVVMKSRFLHLH